MSARCGERRPLAGEACAMTCRTGPCRVTTGSRPATGGVRPWCAAVHRRVAGAKQRSGNLGGMIPDPDRPVLVVVGNGMVGHHFLEAAVERGLHRSHRIVVLGEERHAAYDRVHLTTALEGADPDGLRLGAPDFHQAHGIDLRPGQRAEVLDPAARTVTTSG